MAISQRTESANRLVYVDEAGVAHEILLALLGGQSVWDGRVSQSIPATTGVMSFVGLPAEVSSGSTVTATDVGYMTLTGLVAETSAGSSVSVSGGELTLTGLAADISAGSTVHAEVGYLALIGLDADVTTSIGPVFDPGELHFEGLEASVSVSSDVAAETGLLTFAGSAAEVSVGSAVGAVAGSLTLDGYVAEVSSGSTVTATDVGYMTLTGLAAVISSGSTVTASNTPALTLTGLAADVVAVHFTPSGMTKSGTFATSSSSTPIQVTGWGSDPAYPGSTVTSNALVASGTKTATVEATVVFTRQYFNQTYKVEVRRGSTVLASQTVVAPANTGTYAVSIAPTDVAVTSGDQLTVWASVTGFNNTVIEAGTFIRLT